VKTQLVKVGPRFAGGTVAYEVRAGGRLVGLVGDGRPFNGHGYGGRRWFASWRTDTDTAARWSSGLDYTSRAAALSALAKVSGQ
jgi:hypothetical protein